MKVAIHQPHYLPWLGYLAKWAAADLFVFLDTVQYEKSGYQNRNRIKTRDGPRWLTVPVHAHLGQFAAAGIEILAQEYEHPVYCQFHGEFVPFLSTLDLLLIHGGDALDILRKGDAWVRL